MVAALAYLHAVVVNQASGALDDTKVSLEVAPAGVAVSLGVVGGAVEEDPGACVVLHDVVEHNRTAGAWTAARRTKHLRPAHEFFGTKLSKCAAETLTWFDA